MSLETLESLGDFLCEAVSLIKKMGVKSPILDKADDVCQSILPDLGQLTGPEAQKLAAAAYDMAKRVKDALGSKHS